MKTIFICLFTLGSATLFAQTATLSADSTFTPVKPDCLGNKPLYVVNGRILPCDSVRFIKPEDISEIEVLKGPYAAALYGAIAAENGTVAITTKSYIALQKKISKKKSKEKETEKP